MDEKNINIVKNIKTIPSAYTWFYTVFSSTVILNGGNLNAIPIYCRG